MLHSNQVQIAVIKNSRFAVEERNGNMSFNLTMMAKPFKKRPVDWLRFKPAQEYLTELSKVSKSTLADLVEVRKGGTPELAGTWANDYRIAMRFAQWLDPNFSIAVDELVFKILTKQVEVAVAPEKYGVKAVIFEGRPVYPYTDMVTALGGSARGGTTTRRAKFPLHFVKLYGRNFITPHYADLLAGYYRWKNAQTRLEFGG